MLIMPTTPRAPPALLKPLPWGLVALDPHIPEGFRRDGRGKRRHNEPDLRIHARNHDNDPDEIAPKVDRLDRQEDEIGGPAKVRSARTVRQR